MDTIHAFEERGLGAAPFDLVSVEKGRDFCRFCGAALVFRYVVKSSDGKLFPVGSDCVMKTGDAGLINKTKRALSKKNTQDRHAREAERIAKAHEDLKAFEVAWASEPHPYPDMAARGLTRLDWARWMLANAGNRGKLQVAKALETVKRGGGE